MRNLVISASLVFSGLSHGMMDSQAPRPAEKVYPDVIVGHARPSAPPLESPQNPYFLPPAAGASEPLGAEIQLTPGERTRAFLQTHGLGYGLLESAEFEGGVSNTDEENEEEDAAEFDSMLEASSRILKVALDETVGPDVRIEALKLWLRNLAYFKASERKFDDAAFARIFVSEQKGKDAFDITRAILTFQADLMRVVGMQRDLLNFISLLPRLKGEAIVLDFSKSDDFKEILVWIKESSALISSAQTIEAELDKAYRANEALRERNEKICAIATSACKGGFLTFVAIGKFALAAGSLGLAAGKFAGWGAYYAGWGAYYFVKYTWAAGSWLAGPAEPQVRLVSVQAQPRVLHGSGHSVQNAYPAGDQMQRRRDAVPYYDQDAEEEAERRRRDELAEAERRVAEEAALRCRLELARADRRNKKAKVAASKEATRRNPAVGLLQDLGLSK